jgi:hypothetical protein
MVFRVSIFYILLFLLSVNRTSGLLLSMEDEAGGKPGLFECDSFLEVEIIVDLDTLINDIDSNPRYFPAFFKYKETDGEWIILNVEIRTRGKFRKNPANCDFPPLKIDFKKDRKNTIFESYKDLKMVTHCQSEIEMYNQFVLQEYLIYKSYNLFTDLSFRVRLLSITYIDSKDPGRTIRKYGFFIENAEDVARRNNGYLLDLETVNTDRIDQDHLTLVAFFEYMIINTDWSMSIMHNVELISLNYFEPPYPVPFDFDWSGLINIPYEVPSISGMKIREPERIYKGTCRKKRDLRKAIELFHARKQSLFDLYMDFPYLDQEIKTQTLEELQIFYEILNDKYIFRIEFIEHCKD